RGIVFAISFEKNSTPGDYLMRRLLIVALFLTPVGLWTASAGEGKLGPDPKTWAPGAQNALDFLNSPQEKNGAWTPDKSPGVTGVALTGLLKAGVSPK